VHSWFRRGGGIGQGGAKKLKKGPQAKAAIISDGNWLLEYDGPTTPDELFNDPKLNYRSVQPVRVNNSKVQRTRPIFPEWSVRVEVEYLPDLVSAEDIREFAEINGRQIGLGDWTPKHGRYVLTAVEEL
jgi:hypothetical protein